MGPCQICLRTGHDLRIRRLWDGAGRGNGKRCAVRQFGLRGSAGYRSGRREWLALSDWKHGRISRYAERDCSWRASTAARRCRARVRLTLYGTPCGGIDGKRVSGREGWPSRFTRQRNRRVSTASAASQMCAPGVASMLPGFTSDLLRALPCWARLRAHAAAASAGWRHCAGREKPLETDRTR